MTLRAGLSGEGPQVLLPLQALVYPLPSHLLRAITELHANQLRAAHAGRKLPRYRCHLGRILVRCQISLLTGGAANAAALEARAVVAAGKDEAAGRLRLCYSR